MNRKLALCVAAGLAGASGLGLEILVVTFTGLSLGYGRSGSIGITVFLVGWALGARLSGAWQGSAKRALLAVGVALLLASLVVPPLLLGPGAQAPGGVVAWIVSLLALFAVALPQGVFLPQLARGWSLAKRRDLGLLFGANLAGAAGGAFLIGHSLPALYGRTAAAAFAGGLALLAALVGVAGTSRIFAAEDAAPVESLPARELLRPVHAGLILAVCTGWLGTLEWIGLRLGVLWLGGMQDALTGVLVASMIALGVGAWLLPRLFGQKLRSVVWIAVLCAFSSLAYLHLPFLMAGGEDEPLFLRALRLVGPVLLPFGAIVPLLHRHTAGGTGERLGRLLVFEALGALVGLPISHLLLVPAVGLHGAIVFWHVAAAAVILSLVPRLRGIAALGLVLVVASVAVAERFGGPPALDSPKLSRPELEVLDFGEDEHFAVTVVEDGLNGGRTLMTDGFQAAGTGRDYLYMRALGHLPLLLHPAPERVAVLAFGTGTTAGAVSMHPEVKRIEVLELSRGVTERAHWFREVNRGVLEDSERVTLHLGDGRRTLAEFEGELDVLTMEPLLPDSPFGVYLYTEAFYARARRSLAPGGLVCQWVPPHALAPETFEAVVAAFTGAFEWSGIWLFGTQVVLVGGTAAPTPRSSRFPEGGGALRRQLTELGLDTPTGLLARYVTDGRGWPAAERRLTDADPWIVYRPRRSGRILLGDLPLNLSTLRQRSRPLPTEWWVGLDADAQDEFAALAALRRAREAFAVLEAEARRVSLTDPLLARDGRFQLGEARRLAPGDAEVGAFAEEQDFLELLREGVGSLMRDVSGPGSRRAAQLLEEARLLRPERAYVWVYLAVALQRTGEPGWERVLARALELCPRIRETDAGQRAAALGLSFPP